MAFFPASFMAVGIEEIETTLNVRQRAFAMIEEDHRIVFFGDSDAALAANVARGSDHPCEGHDGLGRAQQAG